MLTTPTTRHAPSGDSRDHVLVRLHADETGAQAMEYAALAGGGATIVGLFITLLQSEPVRDKITEFVIGLFDTLAGSLGGLL